MIDRFRSSCQHTVVGIIAEGIPTYFNSIKSLINRINDIFLNVVISIALFYLHPNSFYIGMAAGFVFHKQVSEIEENVNNVFLTFQNNILFFGVGGLMAIMAAESALVITTLYYSSLWGAKICLESQQKMAATSSQISSPSNINDPDNNV